MSEARDILRRHALRRTSCRQGIIELMLSEERAMSEHEIREKLSSSYDRTTFYRSFKTLEESGIIHKIVLDSQKVRYALARVEYTGNHAHFHCNSCQSVRCLGGADLPPVKLPEGYTARATEMIIHGTCDACNQTKVN
ncbi:MAG: transcriptional repressor [Bacteroidetes bacterium]|nr:transcriptional repressor [Bacteroidota bacterium]